MTTAIRPAREADIPHMAFVTTQAFGGYAEVMYEAAVPGRSVEEIMRARFFRDGATSHFVNSRVAEEAGAILGGLQAYAMDLLENDPDDTLIPKDRYGFFEPFDYLHADGSYYVNAVAVYPRYRGRGVARLLMRAAEADAVAQGFGEISLNVFAENAGAVGLYRKLGYREVARRPVVPHPRLLFGGDLLLMTRRL